MSVHTRRHGAFAKSSTYCLVIPSHTRWLISSLQEMWERSLESSMCSGWNKILRDSLPSPLSVTKWPICYGFYTFCKQCLHQTQPHRLKGSSMRHLIGSPSLHCICSESQHIKKPSNSEKKKQQHSHVSTSVFRPRYPRYPMSSWKSVPRGQTFLLTFKVNAVSNQSDFFILFSKSTTWKLQFSPTWQFYSHSYSWFEPLGLFRRKSRLLHQQHRHCVTRCCIQVPNILNFWPSERTRRSNTA